MKNASIIVPRKNKIKIKKREVFSNNLSREVYKSMMIFP